MDTEIWVLLVGHCLLEMDAVEMADKGKGEGRMAIGRVTKD